jgi:hypothetical protein
MVELTDERKTALVCWWAQYRYTNDILKLDVNEDNRNIKMDYQQDLDELIGLYDYDSVYYLTYVGLRTILAFGSDRDSAINQLKMFPAVSKVNKKEKNEFLDRIGFGNTDTTLKTMTLKMMEQGGIIKTYKQENVGLRSMFLWRPWSTA